MHSQGFPWWPCMGIWVAKGGGDGQKIWLSIYLRLGRVGVGQGRLLGGEDP